MCSWIVTFPQTNSLISITSNLFNTEAGFGTTSLTFLIKDILSIYYNDNNQLIKSYSGYIGPNLVLYAVIKYAISLIQSLQLCTSLLFPTDKFLILDLIFPIVSSIWAQRLTSQSIIVQTMSLTLLQVRGLGLNIYFSQDLSAENLPTATQNRALGVFPFLEETTSY